MSEIDTIIQLRHGPVEATPTYVERLPQQVLDQWWARWQGIDPDNGIFSRRDLLLINLRTRMGQEKITQLLLEYYSQDHE